MEVIIEIVVELFLNGCLALIKGKYPLWLKLPTLLIMSAIVLATIGSIGYLGVSCILEGHFIGGAVILIIEILVIVFITKGLFNSKK